MTDIEEPNRERLLILTADPISACLNTDSAEPNLAVILRTEQVEPISTCSEIEARSPNLPNPRRLKDETHILASSTESF
jgi:hypothetical protein